MIPLKIQDIKLKFFDSRLLSAADKARYGFLVKAGGYIRKVSRNSQKDATKKRQTSNPGEPPVAHRGSKIRYKDTIFFHVDKTLGRVYVGGGLLNGKGGHKCPKSLEYGGPVDVFITTNAQTPGGPRVRQKITVTIKERPNMRPALQKFIKTEQNNLLKNCIRAY